MTSKGSTWSLRQRTPTSVGQIAWDRVGDGPPVVLVHGTPSRSFLWPNVAPVLAERCSVYLYDLLGYGESERHEKQDVSIAVQGRLLAELARGWELDRPALAGHDIGGAIVLRAHLLEALAARRLALVDAVVLRPWITPASRHIQAHLEAYRTMPVHLFREVAAAHLRTATHRAMDAGVFAALFDQWEGEQGQALWLAHVAGFDEDHTAQFEPLMGSMQTPTRIVRGEHDAWLDPQVSERIERQLPRADRVLLPEAGHFCMEDQPAGLARTLCDWLSWRVSHAQTTTGRQAAPPHRGARRARRAQVAGLAPVHTTSPKDGAIAKEEFQIDLDQDTVICPQGRTVPIYKPRPNRPRHSDTRIARFKDCASARCSSVALPPGRATSAAAAARTCARRHSRSYPTPPCVTTSDASGPASSGSSHLSSTATKDARAATSAPENRPSKRSGRRPRRPPPDRDRPPNRNGIETAARQSQKPPPAPRPPRKGVAPQRLFQRSHQEMTHPAVNDVWRP